MINYIFQSVASLIIFLLITTQIIISDNLDSQLVNNPKILPLVMIKIPNL